MGAGVLAAGPPAHYVEKAARELEALPPSAERGVLGELAQFVFGRDQ
jgi:hypothetical protein